jgi:hypothetical protein
MKRLILAGVATLFASAALAETITYNCKMTKRDEGGWVAPEYFFRIDAENGTASIADNPEWIGVKFKDRGNKGYRLVWNRMARATAGGNLSVRYQANLNPADNSVKVRMAFINVNAANKPYGVGTCTAQK